MTTTIDRSHSSHSPLSQNSEDIYDLIDVNDNTVLIMSSQTSSKVQLLFSKSKVYVHPSKSSKDNIPGFLALVRPKGAADKEILLSWIPESVLQSNNNDYDNYVKVDMDPGTNEPITTGSSSLTSSSLSTVLVSPPPRGSLTSYAFSIPLYNIYSIQVRPPSLGWWDGSVIIHTRTEETQPALFFHDSESKSTIMQREQRVKDFNPFSNGDNDLFWGGEQFISCLRNFAVLERSTLEPSIILINPDKDDRSSFAPKGAKIVNEEDAFSKAFRDTRWNILQKLARVTQFSRKAVQNVLDNSPPQVKKLLDKPEVKKIGDDFDVAKVYLAKWAMGIAEEAERSSKKRIVWSDSFQEMAGDFELLNVDMNIERRNEVGQAEWNAFFDHSGRLCITETEVKERIFHGGLAPPVRQDAWLFLTGVYSWHSDADERKAIMNIRRNEYLRLKRQWWDDEDKQKNDEFWKDQKCRIEKDVHRTDRNISLFAESDTPHPDPDSRFESTNPHLEQLKDMLITYNEYNQNLGYVQGMSDLLSPLYVVFQDDAIAFWAFCEFMKRMERNFLRDQSGMREQLITLDHLVQFMLPKLYDHLAKADSTNFFFFFRMLLVWYKREFVWGDVLRLWEVLWTDYHTSQFHLFIALAILDKHKDPIMDHLSQFDEVLKYMNELSMTLNLESVLTRAELLFNRFKKSVDMVDRKVQEQREQHHGEEEGESSLPEISPQLRSLLSTEIIEVHEGERPPDVGGG